MRFKLKSKHVKQAYKVAISAAPIAIMIAEAVFPGSKPVRTASKFMKTFL